MVKDENGSLKNTQLAGLRCIRLCSKMVAGFEFFNFCQKSTIFHKSSKFVLIDKLSENILCSNRGISELKRLKNVLI